MIKPTVGQVLWLFGARGVNLDISQPFKADVAFVHNDCLINVGYLDHIGGIGSLTSVILLQDDDLKPEGRPFCVWMPYQVGQAKKLNPPAIQLSEDRGALGRLAHEFQQKIGGG
jgi:hypothetical protein